MIAMLKAESEETLSSLLMKIKEESEKAALKLNIQKTKIIASKSHPFMACKRGIRGSSDRFYFLVLQKSMQMVTTAMKLKDACSLEGKL